MPIIPDDHAMTTAAAAGGAASTIVNRSQDRWARKLAEGVCGALVGVFWGPSIAGSLGFADERDRVATAFAVGASGLVLLTAVLDWVKGASFRDWLGRFIGPQKGPPTN